MRAFFYISVIASLAFPALVSAAPQPVADANDIVARGGSGCSGCNFLQGLYSDLQGPCNAISMLFSLVRVWVNFQQPVQAAPSCRILHGSRDRSP